MVFLILYLPTLCAVVAQKVGKPFVQAYPARVYGSAVQNWGIGQDKRGMMYFANDQGVLEYDGIDWKLFTLPNNEPVRAICVAEDGRIYVGGVGEFGYLAPNAVGMMEFQSLHALLPPDRQFEDVWSVQVTPNMVYFQTDTHLFGYEPYQKKTITVLNTPTADSDFFLTFYVHQKMWVHSRKLGLFTLDQQTLLPSEAGKELAGTRVYAMISLSTHKILVATREKGLFILEHHPNGRVSIEKWDCEADTFIQKNQVYSGASLPDGKTVLCTRKAGAIVIDAQGKILETFDKNTGLTDENVRAAYLSTDNMLWFALDNGINHVSYYCPIRAWDETRGLRGAVRDVRTFKGETYIATSLGLFVLDKSTDRLEPLQNISNVESWIFELFKMSDGTEKLLAGTNEGIFEVQGRQANLIQASKKAIRSLHQSIHTPEILYVGQKGGLLSLAYRQGSWLTDRNFQDITQEVISILESPKNPNELWISTFTDGTYKVYWEADRKVMRKPYRAPEGLPTLRESRLYMHQNTLLVASPQGLFAYLPEKDVFELSPLWQKYFTTEKRGAYHLAIDAKQSIWTIDRDTRKHHLGFFQPKAGGKEYSWNEGVVRRLPEFSEPTLYADAQNRLWIGGTDGLYRYDMAQPHKSTTTFRTLIREIKLKGDSTIFGGTFFEQDKNNNRRITLQQNVSHLPAFSYEETFEIAFSCAASFYDLEKRTEYSYHLESYQKSYWAGKHKDDKWSAWTRENKRSYTHLPAGTYCFYVKARNVYGEESLLASYRFRVLEPWYYGILALFFYISVAILLIYGIIAIYTRNLRKQKERLEQIVTDRTHELVESSKKLEITHQLLVKHNTDLNDSIDYASRIQRVMLPAMAHIQAAFPASFVLWKPLQKVSGDFYWFAETNMEPRFSKDPHIGEGKVSVFKGFVEGKKIIAAIDCTGHGIPGAFMSMMGDAYLEQIVNTEGVTQPQLILQELDLLIRHALKQDAGENADGMDMAICVVNPNQNVIEFSGAKNGLIYVKQGEANLIRGDRFGIGGAQYNEEEKIFTRHVIPIDEPINFYLYSDGLPDQFGGEKAKKFSTKQMQAFFANNFEKSMSEQFELLEHTIQTWMFEYEQIDDILVIGVRVEGS